MTTGWEEPPEGPDRRKQEPDFSDVLNNMFLSRGKRKRKGRRHAESPAPPEPAPGPRPSAHSPAFGQGPDLPAGPRPGPEPGVGFGANPGAVPGVEPGFDAGPEPESAAFVRPYAWTRGRTRTTFNLEVETLLTTIGQGERAASTLEHRQVAELCSQPRSVAEVAALLQLPLGVARVLLGDMASMGLVVVHQNTGTADGAPDRALMERVLSGLRRL